MKFEIQAHFHKGIPPVIFILFKLWGFEFCNLASLG